MMPVLCGNCQHMHLAGAQRCTHCYCDNLVLHESLYEQSRDRQLEELTEFDEPTVLKVNAAEAILMAVDSMEDQLGGTWDKGNALGVVVIDSAEEAESPEALQLGLSLVPLAIPSSYWCPPPPLDCSDVLAWLARMVSHPGQMDALLAATIPEEEAGKPIVAAWFYFEEYMRGVSRPDNSGPEEVRTIFAFDVDGRCYEVAKRRYADGRSVQLRYPRSAPKQTDTGWHSRDLELAIPVALKSLAHSLLPRLAKTLSEEEER